jgi:citrate synthase
MSDFVTRIAKTEQHGVTVRGLDLVDDIIGEMTYTQMLYFLCTGRQPDERQVRILDACLVTLMEHGWTPSSLISRMMIDSVPDEAQVAIASGLLALGPVFAGTSEGCAMILRDGVEQGGDLDAYCAEVVRAHRMLRKPIPGFGHPEHKPDDPRSIKLFAVARKVGVDGKYLDLLQRLGKAVDAAAGKHITINATGAIGALLLEIGLPPSVMRGISVASRAGGLIGHIEEERSNHTARYIWHLADQNIPYQD